MSVKGRFSELNDDMTQIFMALLTSDNLCKLLYYPDENPLSQPSITNPTKLLYNNIHPYRYIPDIETDTKSYISVVLGDFKNISGVFRAGRITFDIICHRGVNKINQGTRLFAIMNEIDKLFNDQQIASMFKLRFLNADEIIIKPPFVGYSIEYETYDFN